ncbi:unnamed protein product, partial [Iphiclides podalirius]
MSDGSRTKSVTGFRTRGVQLGAKIPLFTAAFPSQCRNGTWRPAKGLGAGGVPHLRAARTSRETKPIKSGNVTLELRSAGLSRRRIRDIRITDPIVCTRET